MTPSQESSDDGAPGSYNVEELDEALERQAAEDAQRELDEAFERARQLHRTLELFYGAAREERWSAVRKEHRSGKGD